MSLKICVKPANRDAGGDSSAKDGGPDEDEDQGDADAGTDLRLVLRWVHPADGETTGPLSASRLALELSVSRHDGRASPYKGDVPFSLLDRSGGVLQLDMASQQWRAVLDAGSDDGPRTIKAGWDGGPTATVTFTVIASPVSVELYSETPPIRRADETDVDGVARWKKSEVVPIQVESSRPLANLTVARFTNDAGVAPSTACTRACSDAGFCACFAVDLAQQTLVMSPGSIDGTVVVGLNPVEDIYGNQSLRITPKAIEVTRFKWVRSIMSGSRVTPTTIAIMTDGRILVGANGGSKAVLEAFHANGQLAWKDEASYQGIYSGPLIGTRGVYLGRNAEVSTVRRVGFDGQKPEDVCNIGVSSSFGAPGFTLGSPGPAESLWFEVSSYGNQYLKGADFVSGACVQSVLGSNLDGRTELAAFGANVVATTDGANGGATQIELIGPIDGGSTLVPGWIVTDATPKNLFPLAPDLWGGAGGAFHADLYLFGFARGGGPVLDGGVSFEWDGRSGGAGVVGGTAGTPIIYSGSGTGRVVGMPVNVATASFSADATVIRSLGSMRQSDRAPILGENGRLYVLGSDGALRSLQRPSLIQEWFWSVPGTLVTSFSQDQTTELNLDLDRDVSSPCSANQPGVLYFAGPADGGANLVAVLVDSAGVDHDAPWPRAQHDPANTGNRDTDLTPYTCP